MGPPHIWALSFALIVVAVVRKFAGALLLKESWSSRIAIGVAMVPRGEVGLIFAKLGRTSNVFDDEVYAALILVIALTTVFSPVVLKWFYARNNTKLIPDANTQEEKPSV